MRAHTLVKRLIESDPDEINTRDYILSTPPWWDDLDDFTQAYIEAALWSTNDESTPSGGEPLDKNYGTEDIAPEALKEMAQDCLRFQQEYQQDLAQYELHHAEWSAAAQGGHDFWLSRNGYGTGFSDRDSLPEDVRDRLQDAAQHYRQVNLYVGDDGKIYQH